VELNGVLGRVAMMLDERAVVIEVFHVAACAATHVRMHRH
jgi:hypothetical protein